VDEIYLAALKLLRARDYTVVSLRQKLQARFGVVPEDVIQQLLRKKYLNDHRFAEHYVATREHRGPASLREELIARGVAEEIVDEVLSQRDWPSLRQALTTKMKDLRLRSPLQPRDAARLFRALLRLGYEEDAIREEIAIHEQ
jgi:SOS response regulatory protein OraA/RecX